MHPEPFYLGPIRVAPYGLAVGTGLLLAVILARRGNDRTYFMQPIDFEKLMFRVIVWGFIGSRLLYCWTKKEDYISSPQNIFKIWEGGLVFYGGPLGSLTYLFWHFFFSSDAKKKPAAERRGGFLRFADIAVPSLIIAHALGRLGCLFAGCCFGRNYEAESIFSVTYPLGSAAFPGQADFGRYPVPIMESIYLCGLFLLLIWLRPRKRFHGQLFFTYMMIYPLGRFFFEMFRADDIRGFVTRVDATWLNDLLGLSTDKPLMLTTSQFISLLVVAGAGAMFMRGRKSSMNTAAEAKT